MSNHATGHAAEVRAAKYLNNHQFKIAELNWKTRYCEIDIVAEKDETTWFIEVKYRKNALQGFGYEYITAKKLKQMHFAAEMWVQMHDWKGDYQLAVVSIDGNNIQLIDEI